MPRYQFKGKHINNPDGKNHTASKTSLTSQYQTRLEKEFLHVLTAIQSMWGYPELDVYFSKLTLCDRDKRKGFPEEVWNDIYMLWHLHQTVLPQAPSPSLSRNSCAKLL